MRSWQQGERSVTMSDTCTAYGAASLTNIAANRQRTHIPMNGNCKKLAESFPLRAIRRRAEGLYAKAEII